jgi:recombination protein RecA
MEEVVVVAASKKTAPPAAVSAVEGYLLGLQKHFESKEIAHLVTDDSSVSDVEVIPTGIPALDLALGCGGIPKGRVIEIYGPEMSGKTTLALQIVAQAQKDGAFCHFIDAEHALDLQYAQRLGVDLSRLPITQPDNGEQALSVAEFAINNGAGVVVIDSVAALVPQAEIEGDMGDPQMGLQARLMSQAMRKLAGIAKKNGTTIIFINQLRMKIGLVFGNPETTTGGNALKFYASVRIDIRKGKPLKDGDDGEAYGQETNVKIVKNKCAPPFRNCSFDLIYGQGFDTVKSLLDVAIDRGIIEQAGAWVKYKDQKWQGIRAAKEALSQMPDTLKEIAEAL